jgi:hypothetical protein
MNVSIEVDTRALRQAMEQAPAKVKLGLNTWIRTTALMTEREAKIDVPPNVDTGQLQSSIHTMFGDLTATVKPTAKHAIFVHEGRRPGKMPPFQEGTQLNRWATKKGMNPFLVARCIGRKGTKKNPFMDKAYRTVKPTAEREAQLMLTNIVRSI